MMLSWSSAVRSGALLIEKPVVEWEHSTKRSSTERCELTPTAKASKLRPVTVDELPRARRREEARNEAKEAKEEARSHKTRVEAFQLRLLISSTGT